MQKNLFLFAGLLSCAVTARANLTVFEANLDGAQEVPPTASTATGFGKVVLNDVTDTITVDESWSGLDGPAIASHIHSPAAAGSNAPVAFPFTGVPAATSGSIPQQIFSVTAAEIANLEAGLDYMNIHSTIFPGGEIRGQLLRVPDNGPGLAGLLAFGGLCLAARLFKQGAKA
jgi:hypothetical protein